MTISGLGLNESKFLARGRLPFVLTVLAFLTGSLGQAYLVRPGRGALGVLLLGTALALCVVAFRRLPQHGEREAPGLMPGWDREGMALLFAASVPAWVGGWLLVTRWDSLSTGLSLYAWSLLLVGVVCAQREGWTLPALNVVRERWLELTLMALVLGLGLLLLVYRLDYYPPPGSISWNDEAQIGKDAYGVIHHDSHPWQFPVSVYTTCLAFLSLGPTVLALRLNFVLMGFLTLVVFYLLTREVFRFPVAVASTFLFAVSRWHIAFSRLALPSTPAMLLEVCTFYLLFRGRRTGGMMSYVLAGMTMSLGLYTHASFRIVPALVVLLVAYEVWSRWRTRKSEAGGAQGSLSRQLAVRWLAFAASCAPFALPFVAFVRREPHVAFGERFSSVMPALFGGGDAAQTESMVERVQRVLGFFNYKGESWGAVNIPDAPMLDAWTGVLFVLGFGCCLVYFWRNRHLFYLSWFLITVIGGGVLTLDLRSHRFAGAMPVLFLFAGVFLDGAMTAFDMAFGHRRRGYFGLLLVPVLMLAGVANYETFFHRQIHAESVRIEFTREVSAVANYMATLGEGYYVYLFANHPYYDPGMDFAWMAGEVPGERAIDVVEVVPSPREAGEKGLVYIVSSPYNVEALAEAVRHYYPEAEVATFRGQYDRYTFASVLVRADEARAMLGLRGSYYHGHEVGTEPDAERLDTQLSFDWALEGPPVPFPFVAQWQGTLFAPHSGTYSLEIEGTGESQISVDGQMLGRGERVELAKGWHTLEVQHATDDHDGSLELLWTPENGDREVIPSRYLSPRTDVYGVLVSVFRGPDFSGQPVEQSIQPSLSLLRMPTVWQSAFVPDLAGELYSLQGRGELRIDVAGSYRFGLEAWNGAASLYLDGTPVAATEQETALTTMGEVELSPGWHGLLLRYSYDGGEFSGVQVYWTPPGGQKEVIPPAMLRPGG
jgi:hypothetical protein